MSVEAARTAIDRLANNPDQSGDDPHGEHPRAVRRQIVGSNGSSRKREVTIGSRLAIHQRSGRKRALTGMARRTLATRSRSISARARPGPSDARATTWPHGSTIRA